MATQITRYRVNYVRWTRAVNDPPHRGMMSWPFLEEIRVVAVCGTPSTYPGMMMFGLIHQARLKDSSAN